MWLDFFHPRERRRGRREGERMEDEKGKGKRKKLEGRIRRFPVWPPPLSPNEIT